MNYYDVLGVDHNASQKEIRYAYRNLVLTHHPDANGDHTQFIEINQAYEILKDISKRRKYDQEMSFNCPPLEAEDVYVKVKLTVADLYDNQKITLDIPFGDSVHTVNISIPRGVLHGETIKYKNLIGVNSALCDLYVTVNIIDNPQYVRVEYDLTTKVTVSTLELITGNIRTLRLPHGKYEEIHIPKHTQPESVITLTGLGLPKKDNSFGDIYVLLDCRTPEITCEDTLEIIKQINETITAS